jgi:hypothetical protein
MPLINNVTGTFKHPTIFSTQRIHTFTFDCTCAALFLIFYY